MENKDLLVRFDWVIKTMLRNKANFDILEGFLSALLKDDITVIEILESEGNQETDKQKFNKVDVLIKDSKDRKIIIEVQNDWESDFLARLLFGTSKTITDYFKLGDPYSSVSKVISVSVQYFNLGRSTDYIYHGGTEIRGVHTGEILDVREQIETIVDGEIKIKLQQKNIFPEYYIISVNRYPDTLIDDIDEWVYMMKNNFVKDNFHSKNIDKAREKLKILNMSHEERLAYERYIMNATIEKDLMSTARKEGIAKGKIEGLQEGIVKGLILGIEAMLDILFGEEAEPLKEQIQKITDIEVLERLKEDLRKKKSLDEILEIYTKFFT